MHITVIVPAFNVAAFLGDATLSVLDQSHSDWSMVVVDDGSTDDPAGAIARFPDSRIRLIHQTHLGVSAARNAGVAAAGVTDAFLFLDGDDWLAPNALAALADALDDAPWAVAACGRYARVAPNGAAQLSPQPPGGSVLERLLTRNLFANGGHLLIRREAVEIAGEFRQDLTYGEDWEYWTRLALLGEFISVPTAAPVLFVRERPGSATLSRATDPGANRPALAAIYRNPGIADRLGKFLMEDLGRRAEAETAWAVGRELIRHGRRRDGRHWLGRSIRQAPSVKRLILAVLSEAGIGPFRPYRTVG